MFELFVNSDLARTQVSRQFSTANGRDRQAAERPRRTAGRRRVLRALASAPSIVWAALAARSH
jgi:hypothetical protein